VNVVRVAIDDKDTPESFRNEPSGELSDKGEVVGSRDYSK